MAPGTPTARWRQGAGGEAPAFAAVGSGAGTGLQRDGSLGQIGSFTLSGAGGGGGWATGSRVDEGEAEATMREADAGAPDMSLPTDKPPIRHNTCFLHPYGIPGSEDKNWLPDRPWMSGCRYHDMVKDTIYLASSRNLENLRKHVEGGAAQTREVERAEFSQSRFRRQRETAALWADIRDTFDILSGKPPPQTPKLRGEAASEAPSERPLPAPLPATPATASQGPGAASYMPRRSTSLPGAHRQPYIRAGKLQKDGGRGQTRSSVGLSALTDYVPFKQEPGTRGLPTDFMPAQPSHMGVLVWDKNRSHTLDGLRTRGWA